MPGEDDVPDIAALVANPPVGRPRPASKAQAGHRALAAEAAMLDAIFALGLACLTGTLKAGPEAQIAIGGAIDHFVGGKLADAILSTEAAWLAVQDADTMKAPLADTTAIPVALFAMPSRRADPADRTPILAPPARAVRRRA